MKKENKKLDHFFEKFENQWDIEIIENNHEERFIKKLKSKKSDWKRFVGIGIAASIIVLLSISIFNHTPKKTEELHFASKETKQTDSIFTVLIERELDKINEKKSPENKKIIADALKQMKVLDADYEKIMQELETYGESKQIIYAMISNLQTRISFLQSVLQHIENKEQKINIADEKTM
ncbi:anti-sigma factor [Flavobacterium sp. DSP2-3-1]|uniref:anti-sigma factor n=1 Tax=Flavobacterium sp. DSP2-3-1 TaxID=2804620 RepID=UPI003CF4243D